MTSPPTSTPLSFANTRDELGVIVDFVTELRYTFGDSDEKLCNYAEILSHLDRSMEEYNKVHRRIFIDFCWRNRFGIIARDLSLFCARVLEYKSGIFEIDFGGILQKADADSVMVIWRYLLTILAMSAEDVDIKIRAKEQLISLKKPAPKSTPEHAGMPPEFSHALSGIMGTMFQKMATNPHAQKIADCKDVAEAMSLMMESGLVQDVMSAVMATTGAQDIFPQDVQETETETEPPCEKDIAPKFSFEKDETPRHRSKKKLRITN
jgi:hypothetical protein